MRELRFFIQLCSEAPRVILQEGVAILVLTLFIFMVMSLATIGTGLVTAWRVGAL